MSSSSIRTPGALFASATLHVVLIALVVWITWTRNKPEEDHPFIIEMVKGEGDNFAATEAPALGVPDAPDLPPVPSVKIDIPPPPEPIVEDEPTEVSPVAPADSPIEAAPEPTVVKSTPVKPAPQPAPPKPVVKEPEPSPRRMTKAEFDRLHKERTSTPSRKTAPRPIVPKRIDTAGIAGGVKSGSTANRIGGANGPALTRQESELSDAYIALLVQRLKQAHQKPGGLSDLLETTVRFRLTSSGVVTNVVVIDSSGNNEFDRSVLAAFRRITLPSPPAHLRTNDYSITFKMKEEG